jgi:predicted phage tail protein
VLERLPLQFAWPDVAGSVHYRFQIAPDARFDRLLADAVTAAAEASWPDLPDGEYQLRVRAIDPDRLEGLNAVHAFSVDARPPPPRLIGLIDGVLTRQARPEFSWSQPAGATAYRFQLARDAAFRELLAERDDLREPRFQSEQALPPGRYYWRVATRDGGGRPGPFSDAQTFHYRPVPPAPDLAPPQIGKQDLSFQWQAVEGAARYHFQLAQDSDFTEIVADATLTEARLVIPRPPARQYYFRARSLDTGGEAGPYGSAQAVTVPPASYWPLLLLVIPLLL